MKTNKILIAGVKVPDGRSFSHGRSGGSTYAGRTAVAMQLIGKTPGTVFTDLTRHRDRLDFWRAVDYLRGRTNSFHRVPHVKTELIQADSQKSRIYVD